MGLKDAIKNFFAQVKLNLGVSNRKTDEISEMMAIMYRKFSTEHGLALTSPMPFSLNKYVLEVTAIETVFMRQFSTITLLTTSQKVVMQKFFDSITARVKHSFAQANRDVEAWQKVVMAPIEAQIREHKNQLKNRMQSIQRIHVATDSLEEKIANFETLFVEVNEQKKILEGLKNNIQRALDVDLNAT
jgi:hypothetical protein